MKAQIFFVIIASALQIFANDISAEASSNHLDSDPQQPPSPKPASTWDTTPITSTTSSSTTTIDPNVTTTTSKPTTSTTKTTTPNTTTTPTTSTTSTTPTTPTTTTTPTTSSTSTPSTTTTTPKPEPDHKFDGPSFIGGMILTLGMMAIAFVSWKFYKARTERNYHTL